MLGIQKQVVLGLLPIQVKTPQSEYRKCKLNLIGEQRSHTLNPTCHIVAKKKKKKRQCCGKCHRGDKKFKSLICNFK